jgi:hypothetical protein
MYAHIMFYVKVYRGSINNSEGGAVRREDFGVLSRNVA